MIAYCTEKRRFQTIDAFFQNLMLLSDICLVMMPCERNKITDRHNELRPQQIYGVDSTVKSISKDIPLIISTI